MSNKKENINIEESNNIQKIHDVELAQIENLDKKNNKRKKNKTEKQKIFSMTETIILVLGTLLIGLTIGSLFSNSKVITQVALDKDKHLTNFIENYNYILDNYYKEVDKEKLINSAIAGMMESLEDPYSMYLDQEASNNFSINLKGSYEGIGVEIAKDPETGYMLITSVFKNSSASEAGLIAGDLILSIDNKDSKELSAVEFSSIVLEGKKEAYSLKILRDEEKLDILLKKKKVTLTSVASEILKENDKKIGYIYIGIFANNTYEQFKKELEILEKEKLDYLIIDVRGNTGGHLTAVDGILDLFLGKDQIMYQFKQDDKVTPVYGMGDEKKQYEIILLGDSVSASASEVLIAGLKENFNSKFIGKKTYGKGTVQELVTLSDGTQYKITVKKWLTPKGNWIDESKGIVPDTEVDLDSKYYETYEQKDDTQLQAVLDYIRNK